MLVGQEKGLGENLCGSPEAREACEGAGESVHQGRGGEVEGGAGLERMPFFFYVSF